MKHRCNQCEALMINGVFCHEAGCPNTNSRYDAGSDEWIKQRKCFECGCIIDADNDCCNEEQWYEEPDLNDEGEPEVNDEGEPV